MDQWEQLRQQCMSCRACGLADTRTNVVFGVGDPRAEVLLVGEAPGASEDRQGEPFVGAAGEDLNGILSLAGLIISGQMLRICSRKNGEQASTSSGRGLRFPGGRHLSTLAM